MKILILQLLFFMGLPATSQNVMTALIVFLGLSILLVVLAWKLKPGNMVLGVLLCLFSPAIGQWYLGKRGWFNFLVVVGLTLFMTVFLKIQIPLVHLVVPPLLSVSLMVLDLRKQKRKAQQEQLVAS